MLVGGDEDSFGDRDSVGQVERFKPSGSSLPFSIAETLVFENNEDSPSSSAMRPRSPLVRLAFSTMVATVCGGALYCRASRFQSN